ncbi:hypothetical protein HME9302_00131 [Alteripontixanthobacter maritimus]|uniref:Cyclic nucleotide-binding domain-containing protein n=1 Tax=Alteripontixanthobacter maritimus TaxID=2161824 RepID=A0A369Q619_9SPHN|nr:Crp/Fnr family transcriptional regulator [Alteripontixanthobacter maritimus]RDC58955.1 hypothetical protein HME9302_00131 [Alteripontixanthobacter maritimus]
MAEADTLVRMTDAADRHAVLRSIFACDDAIAEAIEPAVSWKQHAPGTILARQGEAQSACIMVVSGSAAMKTLGADGQEFQLATVEPGEIFGSYPAGQTARAEISCSVPTEVLRIDSVRLAALAGEHAPVGSGLAAMFARQFESVLDRFALRMTLTATGRVYARLAELADESGALNPAPVIAALAVEAQTTRETASRAVSALERRGILERPTPKTWRILSLRMLDELTV